MKRLIPFALCLCLILGVSTVQADTGDQQPFFVHFVVVAKTLPDGSDSAPAVVEFKKEILKLAGGFTELGSTHGGSLKDGIVKHRENLSFIIGAKKDISLELKALTKRLFQGDGAFILAWPGKVIF